MSVRGGELRRCQENVPDLAGTHRLPPTRPAMPVPRPLFVLGIAVSAASTPLAAQGLLRQHGEVVLASGMPLPGSNGASPNDFPAAAVCATATTGVFTQPFVDRNGTVLFRARAEHNAGLGITASNSTALCLGRTNADLRMVVRQGDPAPGLPAGIRIDVAPPLTVPFHSFRISPENEIVTVATGLADPVTPANTPTTADSAIFSGPAGAMQLLAREGGPVAPIGGGAVYGDTDAANLTAYAVNSSGTVVFRNLMQTGIGGVTTANDGIVLVGTPGNLSILLREGSPWPGAGAAGEIVDRANSAGNVYPTTDLRMNEAGQVVHDVHFVVPSGSATSTANDRAIAIWHLGVDTIVAREGDQAPGMPAGAVFTDASALSGFAGLMATGINNSGTVLFRTKFPTGPGGVTANDDTAFFLGTPGALSLALREGDPAPAALGPGVTIGDVNVTMVMSDAGEIAFPAPLGGAVTAANDSAILVGAPGNFRLVAREGAPAPGAPGFVFAAIGPAGLSITERGHLLFTQQITDGTATKNATFCYTPEHGVRLFHDPTDTWPTVFGASTLPTQFLSGGATNGGDTAGVSFANNGDMACWINFNAAEPTVLGAAIVRGHVGSFTATPSAVPVTGGVPQSFRIDCGPQNGGRIYWVLATSQGTRPGFPSPLGPQNVPLNYDPLWTYLSITAANSPLWVGSVGITDSNGVGFGPATFVMPAGFPTFQGVTLHHAALLFDGALVSHFVTEPSALRLY